MIQRIQTVFFALVAVFQIVFSFADLAFFPLEEGNTVYTLYKVLTASAEVVQTQYFGGMLNGITVLVSIIIIFLYKKRMLQVKLGQLNLLLLAGVITLVFLDIDKVAQTFGENIEPNYSLAMVLPVLSLIMTYLGIHFVKKDEALVRAADRLR